MLKGKSPGMGQSPSMTQSPGMGQLNKGNIGRRAPESENKMPGGINLIAFAAPERGEAKGGFLRAIGRQIKIRQNDYLAFTVTMIAGICKSICLTPEVGMNIFMVCNQAVEQYFGSGTECECKQY
jgi:hypothetical protein